MSKPLLCTLLDHRYRWLDVDPAHISKDPTSIPGSVTRLAYLACTRCLTCKLGPDGRRVRLVETRTGHQ